MLDHTRYFMPNNALIVLIILSLFVASSLQSEESPTWVATDNDAVIKGFERLNETQKVAYANVGGFAVKWSGLPIVSNLIRDNFDLIQIELVNSKLKTGKILLFDVNAPYIYLEMEVDGSRLIFGPLVYNKKGEVLTYPYAFDAEKRNLLNKMNPK